MSDNNTQYNFFEDAAPAVRRPTYDANGMRTYPALLIAPASNMAVSNSFDGRPAVGLLTTRPNTVGIKGYTSGSNQGDGTTLQLQVYVRCHDGAEAAALVAQLQAAEEAGNLVKFSATEMAVNNDGHIGEESRAMRLTQIRTFARANGEIGTELVLNTSIDGIRFFTVEGARRAAGQSRRSRQARPAQPEPVAASEDAFGL